MTRLRRWVQFSCPSWARFPCGSRIPLNTILAISKTLNMALCVSTDPQKQNAQQSVQFVSRAFQTEFWGLARSINVWIWPNCGVWSTALPKVLTLFFKRKLKYSTSQARCICIQILWTDHLRFTSAPRPSWGWSHFLSWRSPIRVLNVWRDTGLPSVLQTPHRAGA